MTATNAYGGSTATSPPLGPVPATFMSTAALAGPRWTARPRISADPGRVGDTLTITPAKWAARPRGNVTRVMRCTNICVAVGSAKATHYTITPADVGSVLWVRETAFGATGSTAVWSSRSVGPVASPSSAAVVLAGGQTALRNSRGAALAFATISSIAPSGDVTPARAGSRTLSLRRARRRHRTGHGVGVPGGSHDRGPSAAVHAARLGEVTGDRFGSPSRCAGPCAWSWCARVVELERRR